MRAAQKKRAAPARATRDTKTHTGNDTAVTGGAQRSAANWFLDAACYARDGDTDQARVATLRALHAMRWQL